MSNNITPVGNSQTRNIGIIGMCSIAVAFTVTLNNFSFGASAVAGLTFGRGIFAMIVAWIALAIVWTLSGLIGSSTGLNAAGVFRYTFGTKGYRIPSLCMGLTLFVFSALDYWYVGICLANMFPQSANVAYFVGVVFIAACACLGAIKNVTSLKWITQVTIPVALVLFAVVLFVTLDRVGGMETILNYQPVQTIPMMTAINILFGSFIAVTAGFSDITCYTKSKKAVYIAMPLCMLVVVFQWIVAQFGVYGFGAAVADFTSLAVALGGAMFYICNVFILIAQANTVPSTTLIIATQLSESTSISQTKFVVIQPVVCAIIAGAIYLGADISIVSTVANVVTCMFGPLLAIIFAEYYVVRKRKMDEESDVPTISVGGVTSLLVSMALGVYLNYFCPISTPVGFITLIFAFVLHLVLRMGLKLK